MLLELPDHLLLSVCLAGLSGRDLASLECTARQFRRRTAPAAQPLPQRAALQLFEQRSDNWRVRRRSGESWACALHVLEHRLRPLPAVDAAHGRTLVCSAGGDLFEIDMARFSDCGPRQLEIDDGDEDGSSVLAEGSRALCVATSPRNGSHHYNAALTGEGLWTWGAEAWQGQFPHASSVADIAAGNNQFAYISATGELFCWRPSRPGQGPQVVTALASERVVNVSCSALGAPSPWGSGEQCVAWLAVMQSGQVAIGTERSSTWAAGTGDAWDPRELEDPDALAHEAYEQSGGTHHQWLSIQWVEFPLLAVGHHPKLRQVSCSVNHFAAVGRDGTLYTWGSGACGKLGHGNEVAYASPRVVETFISAAPTRVGRRSIHAETVSCGQAHTAVVSRTGELYTWGWGSNGQLGLGTSDGLEVRD